MVKHIAYPNLPDIIHQVQLQLEEAQRLRMQHGPGKFLQLKQVEFEMKCIAVENLETHGGFDLKVVSMGGSTKVDNQQIHTVKIVFEGVPDVVNGRCAECGSADLFHDKAGDLRCNICHATIHR